MIVNPDTNRDGRPAMTNLGSRRIGGDQCLLASPRRWIVGFHRALVSPVHKASGALRLLVAAMLTLSGNALFANHVIPAVRVAEFVNVREAPSSKSAKVGTHSVGVCAQLL